MNTNEDMDRLRMRCQMAERQLTEARVEISRLQAAATTDVDNLIKWKELEEKRFSELLERVSELEAENKRLMVEIDAIHDRIME